MVSPEKIVEAIIFVAESPVTPEQVAEIFEGETFEEHGITLNEQEAAAILEDLFEKYKTNDTVFELKRIDKGYQFFTRKEMYPFLHHASLLRNRKKLSRAALETLSIIAYKQPVTKTEIEFIRGVSSDYALQKLLEKNLCEIAGRSDAPGKPLLYKTSTFFMEYFGINEISDLPKLKEFEVDEEEYQAQFRVFVEENDDLKKIAKGANPKKKPLTDNEEEIE